MPEAIPFEAVVIISAVAGFLGYSLATWRHANQQAKDWMAIIQANNLYHNERRDSSEF